MFGKQHSQTFKILMSLLLGAAVGIFIDLVPAGFLRDRLLMDGAFLIGGKLFINAFKLMVVPIVFVSLTLGIASMNSPRSLGRIGGKAMIFYLSTTVFAIVIGLFFAFIISPGSGLDLGKLNVGTFSVPTKNTSITQMLINIVPENPFQALSGNAMLQIIFISIVSGTALSLLGDKVLMLKKILTELDRLNVKIIEMIMMFAPIGIFCLLSRTFGMFGADAFLPLMKYVICVILALLFQVIFVYSGILFIFGRLNPLTFLRKFLPVMTVAFSTSSSNATLPANIETLHKKMGVSERIASLLLSLGATINMDGTAIMQGTAALFIAQLYGIDLTIGQMGMIVFTATLASIGTAGVPGVGLILLAMVLQSVNLPVDGIAVVMGVDRVIDMSRTVVNVTGDAVCACVIAKNEKEFDAEVYSR